MKKIIFILSVIFTLKTIFIYAEDSPEKIEGLTEVVNSIFMKYHTEITDDIKTDMQQQRKAALDSNWDKFSSFTLGRPHR